MAKEPLYACPFCRRLYTHGEVERCPDCELPVVPLASLPLSHEAELLEPPPAPVPPELEELPWTYLGRNRGLLLLVAASGIAVFFAPWLREYAPELRVLSGYEFARHLGWLWAAPVAWFIMGGVVLSRRTIYHMRGARLAVGILGAMALATVALRVGLAASPMPLLVRRYEWGWGLWATGGLAVVAVLASVRFGGVLADMPTKEHRRGDEMLH